MDPECGVTREISRPSVVREALSELTVELLVERSARLESTPRRVATRFGLSLIAALSLAFGVAALPAGTSEDAPDAVVAHPHQTGIDLVD